MSDTMNSTMPAGNGTMAGNETIPIPAPPTLEEMQAMMFPVSPHAAELSRIFIGITTVLLALGLGAFATRMYNRIRPAWNFGLDDYCIVIGVVLTVTDWAMLLPSVFPDGQPITWEQSLNSGKYAWLAIGIWGMAMTFIKASIALTLLRIRPNSLPWKIFLYSIIAVQSIYGVGNLFFNTCIAYRPLRGAWDFTTPNVKMVDVADQKTVSNVGSAINITTDILLSLAPTTFLFKLNRPLRERVFVCILMALGLVASVASIVKTVIVQNWDPTDMSGEVDFQATSITICTWTALELLIGLLAACVPAMKNILQQCLGKVGLSVTGSRTNYGQGYGRSKHSRLQDSKLGDITVNREFQVKEVRTTDKRATRDFYGPNSGLNDSDDAFEMQRKYSEPKSESQEQLPRHAV